MSIFEIAQLLAATSVLLLSLFAAQVRAAAWVAVICIDLLLSTQWWVSGMPYGDVFTAACDFTVCVLIYLFAMQRWERWLYHLYQASMLVSIIDLGASIWAPGWIDHDTYSIVLEAINYSAFLVIGGTSSFAFRDRLDSVAFLPWHRLWSADRIVRAIGGKDR